MTEPLGTAALTLLAALALACLAGLLLSVYRLGYAAAERRAQRSPRPGSDRAVLERSLAELRQDLGRAQELLARQAARRRWAEDRLRDALRIGIGESAPAPRAPRPERDSEPPVA